MKPADYALRLRVLRRERDHHQSEVARLQAEIDSMEGDTQKIAQTIGKYVCVDNTVNGGYKYYIHVKSYHNRPKGVCLVGPGFSDSRLYLEKTSEHTVFWTDTETIQNITEEEFYKAFDDHVKSVRDALAEGDEPSGILKTKLPAQTVQRYG